MTLIRSLMTDNAIILLLCLWMLICVSPRSSRGRLNGDDSQLPLSHHFRSPVSSYKLSTNEIRTLLSVRLSARNPKNIKSLLKSKHAFIFRQTAPVVPVVNFIKVGVTDIFFASNLAGGSAN